MNLQENRCSPKKKVNTLADSSEVDVSCSTDTKPVAKLNGFKKNKEKTFF